MLAGDPVASQPVAATTVPPAVTVPDFTQIQGDAAVDVVAIVILTPFTQEAA